MSRFVLSMAALAFATAATGCGVRSFVVGESETDSGAGTEGTGSTSDTDASDTDASDTDASVATMGGGSDTTSSTGAGSSDATSEGESESENESEESETGTIDCSPLAQAQCEEADDCEWVSDLPLCVPAALYDACESASDEEDCLAIDGCDWDPNESECDVGPV